MNLDDATTSSTTAHSLGTQTTTNATGNVVNAFLGPNSRNTPNDNQLIHMINTVMHRRTDQTHKDRHAAAKKLLAERRKEDDHQDVMKNSNQTLLQLKGRLISSLLDNLKNPASRDITYLLQNVHFLRKMVAAEDLNDLSVDCEVAAFLNIPDIRDFNSNNNNEKIELTAIATILLDCDFQPILYKLLFAPIPWIVFEAAWVLSNATTAAIIGPKISSSYVELGILERAVSLINLAKLESDHFAHFYPENVQKRMKENNNNNNNSNSMNEFCNNFEIISPETVDFRLPISGERYLKKCYDATAFCAVSEQCTWLVANVMADHHSIRDMCLKHGMVHHLLSNIMPIEFMKTRNNEVSDFPSLNLFRINGWALANCFRGKPHPPKEFLQEVAGPLARIVDCYVKYGINFRLDHENNKNNKSSNDGTSGSPPVHTLNADTPEQYFTERVEKIIFQDSEFVCDIMWAINYCTDVADGDESFFTAMATGEHPLLQNLHTIMLESVNPLTQQTNAAAAAAGVKSTFDTHDWAFSPSNTAPKLQLPALRIFGNYAVGSDELTRMTLDSGVVADVVTAIWMDPGTRRSVRKEIAWFVSNICASGCSFTKTIIETSPIIELMVKHYLKVNTNYPEAEVVKEILWVASNALASSDAGVSADKNARDLREICAYLVQQCEVLMFIKLAVKSFDTRVIRLVLELVELILGVGDENPGSGEPNRWFLALLHCGIPLLIEELMCHSDHNVYAAANKIVETYFSDETWEEVVKKFNDENPNAGDNYGDGQQGENGLSSLLPSTSLENVKDNFAQMERELEDMHIGEAVVKRTK